jgi:hypothetical protein
VRGGAHLKRNSDFVINLGAMAHARQNEALEVDNKDLWHGPQMQLCASLHALLAFGTLPGILWPKDLSGHECLHSTFKLSFGRPTAHLRHPPPTIFCTEPFAFSISVSFVLLFRPVLAHKHFTVPPLPYTIPSQDQVIMLRSRHPGHDRLAAKHAYALSTPPTLDS